MSMPDFLVIAALIAVARWVIRSVREASVELPPGGESRNRQPAARPAPQRTSGSQRAPAQQRAPAPQRTAAAARTAARPAAANSEWQPAWNIVLDVPEDAPRSEIQAAVKRRIAVALSNGDRGAIEEITRAAATGMKLRALSVARQLKRGRQGS